MGRLKRIGRTEMGCVKMVEKVEIGEGGDGVSGDGREGEDKETSAEC